MLRKMDPKIEMDPMDLGGGNTKPPLKRCSLAKKWCFTYNNYPKNWMDLMDPKIRMFHLRYVIGEEVGDEGTPHLQGYIESDKKIRPMEKLKWPKQIHWEAAKGDRMENLEYCTKDGKYKTNMKVPKPLKLIEPKGWQLPIMKLINEEADDRSIHWFWEPDGGYGKSSLVKYLCAKHDAIVCSGKAADMKYMIVKYKEKHGLDPEIVIFDVPRSSKDYLSYTGIEEIKNGCFASSKYETDMVIMNSPHVLVFANFAPDYDNPQMSVDRFVVSDLRDYDPQRKLDEYY